MIVNYKKYPALKKLVDGRIGDVEIRQEDAPSIFALMQQNTRIADALKEKVADFSKEIFVISNSFFSGMINAHDSLMGLYKESVLNNTLTLDISGVFLIGDFVYFCDYHIKDCEDWQRVTLYTFTKRGELVLFYEDDFLKSPDKIGWCSLSYFGRLQHAGINTKGMTTEDFVERSVSYDMVGVILAYMFKCFAQVETKEVEPKGAARAQDKELIVNDTNIKCTYLDSKWFTNIVRSAGFSVRGHFRLQPKKVNGEWTKELIYINAFEKHGYTSKARIINQ